MRQSIFLILLLLMLIISCKEKSITPTEDCSIDYIDSSAIHPKGQIFQNVLNKYTAQGLPGITLLIKDGNGVWTGASGKADIDKNINMRPCHIGKVASITKIFMGVLTMKLVEQGFFSLDDKISNWIPSSHIEKIQDADRFTIGDLLQHRTGVYDVITSSSFYLAVLNNPPKKWSQEELIKFAYNQTPAFNYGSTVGYSNTNFLLLSMVIDKATGKSHADLLRQLVMGPLGLNDSYYYYQEELPAKGVAQGYFDLYNNETIANLSSYNTGSGNGYTGLYSTVHDLYLFTDALFVKQTLVSSTSLDQMLTFDPSIEYDRQLGYAVQKDFFHTADEYAIGHRGRDLAYSADMFYFPVHDKVMVIIMNYGTDAESGLQGIFEDCRQEIVEKLLE